MGAASLPAADAKLSQRSSFYSCHNCGIIQVLQLYCSHILQSNICFNTLNLRPMACLYLGEFTK